MSGFRKTFAPLIDLLKAGAVVGSRPAVNLIEGDGVTLDVIDNPTSDRIDVTVSATGGQGLSARQIMVVNNGGDAIDGAFDMSGDAVIKHIWVTGTAFDSIILAGCLSLKFFDASNNAASLNSIDVTGCDALEIAYFAGDSGSSVAAIDLSDCTSLRKFAAVGVHLPTIDLSGLTSLEEISLNLNDLTSLSLAGLTSLMFLEVSNNAIEAVSLTGASALNTVYLFGNALPEAQVDAVLAFLDTAGTENGTLQLDGGTNSVPSAAGLVSKANLEGKGWSVTVNE